MKYVFSILLMGLVLVSCKKEELCCDAGVLSPVTSLESYESQIKTGVTLVFFHATWCSICKEQRPAVEALTTDAAISQATFLQVDTDQNKAITDKYDIPGQPIILIYKDNVEKHRLTGKGHSQQKLTDLVKALL
jgi:thioredoxin 1